MTKSRTLMVLGTPIEVPRFTDVRVTGEAPGLLIEREPWTPARRRSWRLRPWLSEADYTLTVIASSGVTPPR